MNSACKYAASLAPRPRNGYPEVGAPVYRSVLPFFGLCKRVCVRGGDFGPSSGLRWGLLRSLGAAAASAAAGVTAASVAASVGAGVAVASCSRRSGFLAFFAHDSRAFCVCTSRQADDEDERRDTAETSGSKWQELNFRTRETVACAPSGNTENSENLNACSPSRGKRRQVPAEESQLCVRPQIKIRIYEKCSLARQK